MNAGKVKLLVVVGGNPVYDAPADLKFLDAYERVALRAHITSNLNETSRHSHWNAPLAHYMECWSDARAYDGTASIQQPTIEPLYGGKGLFELLAVFTDATGTTAYDGVRAYWQGQKKAAPADFEAWWKKALHDGYIAGSAFTPKTLAAKPAPATTLQGNSAMEVVFRPDPTIYDGRFNNNGWLQELPKQVTKLTWDNAAMISPKTAADNKLQDQYIANISVNGVEIKAPVKVTPGHPDNSITLTLGYGREFTGRIGTGTGYNAYPARTSANQNMAFASNVQGTDQKIRLAVTQYQYMIESGKNEGQTEEGRAMEDRAIVREATLDEFRKNPDFANEGLLEKESKDVTLYPNWTEDPTKVGMHQWGMAIDMNSCVGCNACVVACVAENNIAVVGKEQVLAGRAMHWIRIDTYFSSNGNFGGDVANPRAFFQPIPCQQCENAPCEPVCPVGATVHSTEGLNDMVYNRCVGTRYCSNNCPYKVRRFNFLLWQDWTTPQYKMMRNPEVSVRSRGVMEKCTYCIQRISQGRYAAEKENRPIKDGEVITACQQACPADAIVFGDLSDPNARVSKLKAHQRNYGLLEDLNTRPRTTYLAVVRNPNPELEQSEPS
jgi:molybdopterin-containing oxidoreductase family iron-sulfur binding subunit